MISADDIELAYLAGAMDSDGTIGVKRSTYAMRVTCDADGPTFSERLALRQVTPHIPHMLKARFGGGLYITKPYSVRGKPLWSWATTDLKAVAALTALLPYLRVKREQALNCLALRAVKTESMAVRVARGRGHVGAARRPAAITEQMDALYERAKALNSVGIAA